MDLKLGIKLLSINDDDTTTIRLKSGQQLSAKPDGFYVCDDFGREGLHLISASSELGTAQLRSLWCESR